MPYYKDAQPMYAQQNAQRVTPLSQEMYTPPQYLQTSQSSENSSITDLFTKYWWIVAIVLIVLVFVIYMWYYGSNKSGDRIEF
jgi:hypothetical protein